MVFYFPDSDTLRLALTSGAVPAAVSATPVRAGFGPDGEYWVEPSVALPRAAQRELARLGVNAAKGLEKHLTDTLTCWLQLFPLQRQAAPPAPSAQTPVLFELPDAKQLPAIAGEILRLGNDRQGFRGLAGDDDPHALLRVVGPPYYSLLRALDRDGHAAAPLAYVEAGPRLWVQVGHAHPLLDRLQAPPGKLVLLRPPRAWLYLDDAPWRDVYDIVEFILPQAPAPLTEAQLQERLRVPLRLVAGGAHDVPELWVLRERGLEQIDELVRTAGDALLPRLAFAVGEHGGRRTFVLRVRPSKLPAPVLVLADAVAFRPYLHLQNLFLPCGTRLQPIRRDAIRTLLAEQPGQITWLYPDAGGHGFTPESLPDHSFRPLTDWIDYVLEHDHVALQTWVESTRFDFDAFVCRDDEEPTTPKPKKAERDKPGGRGDRGNPAANPAVQFQAAPPTEPAAAPLAPLERKRVEPGVLEKELRELERQFVACTGAVDAPERQALWPRLADLYGAVGQGGEAMICWANALWHGGPAAPAHARHWAAHVTGNSEGLMSQTDLGRVLGLADVPEPELRRVVACALVAPERNHAGPLHQLLAGVQTFLQRQEQRLPVRVVWLAALALYQLSGSDVLALTRCRDRLLERLYRTGLSSDLDLPKFLRFTAVRGDRVRAFRDWLVKLPDRIEHWLTDVDRGKVAIVHNPADPKNTFAYAQLALAFALARLGDDRECRRLQTLAHGRLQQPDLREPELHTLTLAAFDFRLRQACERQPVVGPLPQEWAAEVGGLDHTKRYKLDKLRQYSRILEPHVKVEPHFRFIHRYASELEKELNRLQELTDRHEVQDEVRQLLTRVGRTTAEEKEARARLLTGGLNLAPRVGESLAEELLAEVFPCCDALEELGRGKATAAGDGRLFEKQAALLEEALFVAAHFNQTQRVQECVNRFRRLFQAQRGSDLFKALNSLAAQSFRGLRKLGLRDEIDQLLRQMAEVILRGREMKALREEKQWPDMLTALLRVAAGWYYFGREEEANAVVEEARRLLYTGTLDSHKQYPLAIAYIATLTEAPVDQALRGIEELFDRLQRVQDGFESNSHFAVRHLSVIESVVLAVVSDDFAGGSEARRWLDDEEYLIRRRIHQDVAAVV
jgi:hypothetical protein